MAQEKNGWQFDSLGTSSSVAKSDAQQIYEVLLKMLDRWNAHDIEGYLEVYWKSLFSELSNDQLNAHHTIAAATTSAATIMMNALNLFIGFSLYCSLNRSLRPCLRSVSPRRPIHPALTSPYLMGCKPDYEHAEFFLKNKFISACRGHEKYGQMIVL
jgi:hypothetical protein